MTTEDSVVVIGAGMAGLVAATELVDTHRVVMIDKGRGPGGRMATRRIGEATFDHGAQFFSARSEEFAGLVARWRAEGVVTPWGTSDTGVERFRGSVSMNAVAKHLAQPLDVRCGSRVTAVSPSEHGWLVAVEGAADPIEATVVLLTSPVPQSLDILDAGGVALVDSDRDALEAISYDPCLAVLIPLGSPSHLAGPGVARLPRASVGWVAANDLKGISAQPALTVHPTAEFSRLYWDLADSEVVEMVLVDLVAAGVIDADHVTDTLEAIGVQRWRYARPLTMHPERYLAPSGHRGLVFAGDAFSPDPPRVEGAVRSGSAAARYIDSLLN